MKTTTVRLDDEHEELMAVIVDRLQITSAEVMRKAFAAYVKIASDADEVVREVVEQMKAQRAAQIAQETKDKLGEDALEDFKRTRASHSDSEQERKQRVTPAAANHAGD